MNEFISGFLYTIIAYGTPLILCSLGGMMTGLSGRFNLGMEGMMLFSAFFSLYFANLWGSLWLGLLMGVGGIPTIQYGPGDANAAHAPDEWVPVDEVRTTAQALVRLILQVCGPA